jgi:hypothetical protein
VAGSPSTNLRKIEGTSLIDSWCFPNCSKGDGQIYLWQEVFLRLIFGVHPGIALITFPAMHFTINERRKSMKSKKRGMFIMILLTAITIVVVPALAQEKPADNMQIVLEKIRADKKLLVAENMQLTEAEAKAFWPVYDQYQDELFLLRSRTAKLIKDYTEAYDKMTNDNAKKLLDELMNIEALGPKLRQAYLPKFRKVLPETKVVRYYQIENKINAALMYELAANIPLLKTAR